MTPEIEKKYGPNVAAILCGATRVIRGQVPSQVRKELAAAVKDGVLGHFKRDGLKPEIYFHPDHKNGAIERQIREARYSVGLIAGVMLSGSERAEHVFNALTEQEGDDA